MVVLPIAIKMLMLGILIMLTVRGFFNKIFYQFCICIDLFPKFPPSMVKGPCVSECV